MTVWDELRVNMRQWWKAFTSPRHPQMVPMSEHAREISLRLNFETRYYLLMRVTGKKISSREARAWLLDQPNPGERIRIMHETLMPEAYEPFLTNDF